VVGVLADNDLDEEAGRGGPRLIGRGGAGSRTMREYRLHASFGRTCRMTL
jgi:hypothetical protein